MKKRRLGRTDMEVSVLGFGGSDVVERSAHVVERLLQSAFDVGVNVIDTAECYEHSEELIGQATRNRRDRIYLFTKCGHPRDVQSEDWSRQSILETIERSLRRLQTDRIDLIQLHGASEAVMMRGEAIAALETAREKGFVRYLGYSGDGQDALYAVKSGAFDTLQTSINIADQEAISSSVPLAREKEMGVIAKRPLANVAWKTGHKPMKSYHHEYWERLRKLNYDFLRDYLPEESIATALRFTLSVPGVHTAIIGTSKPERWSENASMIANGSLGEDDFQAIRERWQDVAPRTWIGQP